MRKWLKHFGLFLWKPSHVLNHHFSVLCLMSLSGWALAATLWFIFLLCSVMCNQTLNLFCDQHVMLKQKKINSVHIFRSKYLSLTTTKHCWYNSCWIGFVPLDLKWTINFPTVSFREGSLIFVVLKGVSNSSASAFSQRKLNTCFWQWPSQHEPVFLCIHSSGGCVTGMLLTARSNSAYGH